MQTQARQLLIATGAFASVHEVVGSWRRLYLIAKSREEVQHAQSCCLLRAALPSSAPAAIATKLGYGVARNLVASGYPRRDSLHQPQRRSDSRPAAVILRSRLRLIPIDLVVVIVPAPLVPQTIEACGRRGIRWAIIVSGGFRETDRAGADLEEQIVAIARRYGMRLIGPNCIGLIDTHVPFNTTFIKSVPKPGEIAFVSQSGAICQAVIDWGTGMGFGFSRIASLGNQADLSEAEVITALASDPNTRVITMYLEGVKDGAQFKQAVSEAAREKSIVALKVGRTAAGKRAVSSHTGALAGQETAYDVVFDRYGILRANNTEELFDWARALAWCPPLQGDRVAVLTNAGGPGILAVDAIEANGLRLATLSAETVTALRSFLLPHASFNNPIDMLASAGPNEYAAALRALLADDECRCGAGDQRAAADRRSHAGGRGDCRGGEGCDEARGRGGDG